MTDHIDDLSTQRIIRTYCTSIQIVVSTHTKLQKKNAAIIKINSAGEARWLWM